MQLRQFVRSLVDRIGSVVDVNSGALGMTA